MFTIIATRYPWWIVFVAFSPAILAGLVVAVTAFCLTQRKGNGRAAMTAALFYGITAACGVAAVMAW